MYIANFYPSPMGGMEMQGLNLSKHLIGQGQEVIIITHGFKGCKKKDSYQGVPIIRLFSWFNWFLETVQQIKSRFTYSPVTLKTPERRNGDIPYDPANSGLKITGNLYDLIIHLSILVNFSVYMLFNRKEIGIIHVHGVPWVSWIGVLTGKIFKVPVLVKESTTIGLQKFDDFIFGKSMRKVVLRNAHFVAISKYISQVIVAYGVNKSKIHYVPNGVIITEQKFKDTKDENVLFVGNLTQGAAKGLDVLLEAWKDVIIDFPNARLLIAGKNNQESEWLNFLRTRNMEQHVCLLGSKKDMQELYLSSFVFVSPSRREGLSNALLEAMAVGIPCIATNISGSQDFIEDGITGLLVEAGNHEQLSVAIKKMLMMGEARLLMGMKGSFKVKKECNFEGVTGKYMSIYSTMLNQTAS